MAGEIGQYRVFSKYRLIARLGSGGMAEVFLALTGNPRSFNKLQVLKVLRSDLPERERADFVRMFQDEGRLAARLSHPNIVQSHEVGSEEGHEFIAMEYLEGQPLSNVQERAWLEETPGFPLEMQLHVLCLVLDGLDYAHNLTDYGGRQLNIVHRDVSPQNVFITYSGHVKLVDFGIAKTLESSKTRAGVVKGKVPYMSPEQVLGGAIDRRADLFSVGVLLWEAIACRPMHGTASVYEILRRLVQGELPAIRSAVPDVPEALAKILDRALALQPDRRYPDAATFREELAAYLEGRKVSTRAVGERVSLLFAEERREINEVIRCALTEASDDLGSRPFDAVHLLPTLKVLAARVSTNQNTSPTTARSTTPPLQGTTPPPVQMAPPPEPAIVPARKVRIAIVSGAVLTLLLVFGLVSRSSSRDPVSSLNAASPSPVKQADVRVSIRAHPDTAALTLDGRALGPSPYSAAQPRDGKQHELVVSAAGYQPRTVNIQFDHDVDLEIGLLELQAPPPSSQATPPKPSVNTRKPTALITQHAPTTAAKKPDDTEPYRDLPAQKRAGTKVPPLDTSESPW